MCPALFFPLEHSKLFSSCPSHGVQVMPASWRDRKDLCPVCLQGQILKPHGFPHIIPRFLVSCLQVSNIFNTFFHSASTLTTAPPEKHPHTMLLRGCEYLGLQNGSFHPGGQTCQVKHDKGKHTNSYFLIGC